MCHRVAVLVWATAGQHIQRKRRRIMGRACSQWNESRTARCGVRLISLCSGWPPRTLIWRHVGFCGREDPPATVWINWWSRAGLGDAFVKGNKFRRYPENASMRHGRSASRCARDDTKPGFKELSWHVGVGAFTRLFCSSLRVRLRSAAVQWDYRELSIRLNWYIIRQYGWSEQHPIRRIQEYPAL